MASEVEIYNIALTHCGADTVLDPAQLTENGKVMQARYPSIRDAVLRAHPWNCALEYAALAKDTVAPPHTYANAYTLPVLPYCLRLHQLGGAAEELPRKVAGRKIFTDAGDPLDVIYIARVTDTGQFDALLVQTIGVRLAAAAAYRVTENATLVAALWEMYEDVLAEARSIDGMESTPEDTGGNELLNSRL